MAQLRFFLKLFILCTLEIAVRCQEGKTESKDQPKNIIVILEAVMPYNAVPGNQQDLDKKPAGDHLSVPPTFEKMAAHGVILQKEPEAHGVDLGALKVMFNGLDSEDEIGNHSTVKPSMNLMHLAHQAGKATGLISTTDVISEIPAIVYGAHIEPSVPVAPNCSKTLHQLINMDVILCQPPTSCKERPTLNEREIKNCFINNASNKNRHYSVAENAKYLEALTKENGRKVIGLFKDMKNKHWRDATSSGLQILQKNENGFFLVITVLGKSAESTRKMVSQLLEDFLASNHSRETLVIVTSVEDVTCCQPCSTTDGQKGTQDEVQASSESENKQRNYTSDHSGTANILPHGNISEKNTNSTELQKTTQVAMEISSAVEVVSTPSETNGGEVSPPSGTTESSTGGGGLSPAPLLSTEKNENISPKGNFSLNEGNPTTADENGSLGKNLQVESKSVTSGSTYKDYSDVTVPSSAGTSLLTEEVSAINGQGNTTDVGTGAGEEETATLSNAEGLPVSEKVHPNGTDHNLMNPAVERRKREVKAGVNHSGAPITVESHQGVSIYATGPGSSLLKGTLKPLTVWTVMKKYISSDSTTAEFSKLKEKTMKTNDTTKIDLSAVAKGCSNALIWNKWNFLGLETAIMYIIVVLN